MSPLPDDLAEACDALRAGRHVLLYDADGREEEVDLFVAAEHATPAAVRTLRQTAGGLVFLAVDPRVGHALGLPFLQDLFAEATPRHPILGRLIPNDIKYDTRSSFSLTLNHRKTFTGITDDDRSQTITEFAKLAQRCLTERPEAVQEAFGKAFRAPGHVHLCVGADKLLHQRKGHTEIAVALARLAGAAGPTGRGAAGPAGPASIAPVVAGAEMLGDHGKALPKADALAWAKAHGAVLLDGKRVEDAWVKLEAAQPASR